MTNIRGFVKSRAGQGSTPIRRENVQIPQSYAEIKEQENVYKILDRQETRVPLSRIVKVGGAPTHVLPFFCSMLNALHSGPGSKREEDKTNPRCSLTSSPISTSWMRSTPPQLGKFLIFTPFLIKIHA